MWGSETHHVTRQAPVSYHWLVRCIALYPQPSAWSLEGFYCIFSNNIITCFFLVLYSRQKLSSKVYYCNYFNHNIYSQEKVANAMFSSFGILLLKKTGAQVKSWDGVHNEVVGYSIVLYFNTTIIIVRNKKQWLIVFAICDFTFI